MLHFCFLPSRADLFSELAGVVAGKESEDSIRGEDQEKGEDILEIVGMFSEEEEKEAFAKNVLDFVEGVYIEHGYHETGDWSGKNPRRKRGGRYSRYVPYKGVLPEFDNSEFQMPADGGLTSRFGYRPDFHRFHYGIDIKLQNGDTVKCVLPGVVTKTGYDPSGYGKYVIVSHAGGIETVYGHLQRGIVKGGDKLEAGHAIGIGGETGNATGPHLHFETRYFGRPVDPIVWFKPYLLFSE
ncbi:MAG: M23 family metallopeptidase [Muribaculaceae bacterium]|nr:M23 family metallopeptidase [Muribaculaceae bacterium]